MMTGDRVADLLAEMAHQHDRTANSEINPRVVVEAVDSAGESYFPIEGVTVLDDGTLAVSVKLPLHAATVEVMGTHWPRPLSRSRNCACGWRWTPGEDHATHVAVMLLEALESHRGR